MKTSEEITEHWLNELERVRFRVEVGILNTAEADIMMTKINQNFRKEIKNGVEHMLDLLDE